MEAAAQLTPIDRRRLSDLVVEQITSLIGSGGYEPSERLPSERELAKRFAVSRASVRESLRILESMGLIEVRPGVGAMVAPHSSATANVASYVWTHPSEVLAMFEVREVVSGRAAELAAQRITDDELHALERNVLNHRAVLGTAPPTELALLDIEFHDQVFAVAGSAALKAVNDCARAQLGTVQHNVLTQQIRREKAIAEHDRVVAAIRVRDPQLAADAMRTHIRRAYQAIQLLVRERLEEAQAED